MNSNDFLLDLDKIIEKKHLLNHKFYKAWSQGKLSIDCLKEYANNYYHHVQAFPRYISQLHTNTECPMTRKELLQNLSDEEAGSPNHPDLWKNFALSLDVTNEEIQNHTPNSEISHLIETFKSICKNGSTAEGIASLYAYESQIPAICVSKIEGLKKHYSMNDPQSFQYFTVHIKADEKHAYDERKLLEKYVTNENQENIKSSVNNVLDALWDFLSGLVTKYKIECDCEMALAG